MFPTLDAVRAKLDQPIALGYSNVGVVIESRLDGRESGAFKIGDRVASNGPHAELVCVPKNLCARVPDSVSDEDAAFTVVAAIGLQGIRLAQPALGEAVVVTGLGLIGLLCVQLLRAQGCRVLGIDFDSSKCALAQGFGAETVDLSKGADPLAGALAFSRGRGMDAVLITASTQSNEPVHQAALMCRKRGRIVLVGVVGLELSRADFYEKELTFQVSCSYGPGRYDDEYEQKGRDYPFGLVRWTEQRNFEAVLDMMAAKRLDVAPLISHRFKLDDALEAYATVSSGGALGILLEYPGSDAGERSIIAERTVKVSTSAPAKTSEVVIGVLGAGNFTGQILLPSLHRTGVRLKTIVSTGGVTASHFAKKFSFEQAGTDAERIFNDPEINAVLICTRHNTHARYVLKGLRAGQRVYVEKPLCLTNEELDEIRSVYEEAAGPAVDGRPGTISPSRSSAPFLMVGFNRRFAPQVVKMKSLLASVPEPKTFVMTVNAGSIAATHWTQDPEVGGGRIIGEGCHFIDLLRFLAGGSIVSALAMQVGSFGNWIQQDKMSFMLKFSDGSIGTVHYFANGHKSYPKERLEVFCAGRILQLDNFRKLKGFGWPRFTKMNLWSQDKGHKAEMEALIAAIQTGKASPIPFDEIVEVTRASFDLVEQIRSS
ncbi:MAG TPA: bi-domain-containing oxidoreductase [Chthoniobacterales bacterium]